MADPKTEEELEFQKITGEQIELWQAADVDQTVAGNEITIWASQLATNVNIANSRTNTYNADKVYKNNELRILAVSHQYDFIAKQINIYRNMEKLYSGKKAFAIAMAEINHETGALGGNTPMYNVWLALQDQADEDKANDDLRKFVLKFEGVKSIGNNFEALHRYCQLMKMNLQLEAVNTLYDVTGLIDTITLVGGITTIAYTNYKTQANESIDTAAVISSTNVGKIISFDIDIDDNDIIATDSSGSYLYQIKDNTISKEEEMWNALGADLAYDPQLNEGVTEMDTKRNYNVAKNQAKIINNDAREDNLGYKNDVLKAQSDIISNDASAGNLLRKNLISEAQKEIIEIDADYHSKKIVAEIELTTARKDMAVTEEEHYEDKITAEIGLTQSRKLVSDGEVSRLSSIADITSNQALEAAQNVLIKTGEAGRQTDIGTITNEQSIEAGYNKQIKLSELGRQGDITDITENQAIESGYKRDITFAEKAMMDNKKVLLQAEVDRDNYKTLSMIAQEFKGKEKFAEKMISEVTGDPELVAIWTALKEDATYQLTDYENRTDAELDSFRYRNLSALGQMYLGISKYAEKLEIEASDQVDKDVWKRIRDNSMMLFKQFKRDSNAKKQ